MTAGRIDLSGTWRLGWTDGIRGMSLEPTQPDGDDSLFIDALVPGEIHLDLMRAGLIEDPSLRLNAWGARWVEECVWWYRRTFDVPADAVGAHAWLAFEQLDLNARVFLNGELVATHRNAFRPLRADVTGRLREGANHIAVQIDSGVWTGDELEPPADRDWNRFKRPWLRKPQYQWGWDWTTRYLNVGIGGAGDIVWTTAEVVLHQLVPLVEVSEDLRDATVGARLVVESFAAAPVTATARASVAGASVEKELSLESGERVYDVVIEVEEPELWWPAGHGEQPLHELEIELTAGSVSERAEATIGFRRVEIDQDAHPDGGRFFVLRVNSRPIFCKGANTAPLDMIPARLDRARYEGLVSRALEAGFNFLRINGTGLYESKDFYGLCDRHGILVWQDITLTCARYPATDQGFLDEIRAEFTHQARRLAPHPSLVIWCGSNENEWLYWDHERDRRRDLPDGHLYRLVLPEVLAVEDPTRIYIPSSPYSPDDTFPNEDDSGDQHPWSVGMGNAFDTPGWDIRRYREMTSRFADEGGIIGPPALPTIEACLPEGHRHLRSVAWYAHDNTISSRQPSLSDETLYELTGLAASSLSVDEYAYWGGLVQGEGLREYVENFRRRMFDSAAAVFWSFNDCWPTTRGWTILDYYLRRTPGFWPVRRAMAPVHVVVARDGEEVTVYGVNDTQDQVSAELSSGFFRTDGPGDHASERVTLRANASTPLRSLGAWQGDPAESIAFALLRRPGELDARSRLILPTFRELRWTEPEVSVRLEDGKAVFESDAFAWGVCLDLSGEQPLPDNFFDVWPGIPYALPWPGNEPPEILHVGNLEEDTA